MNNMTFKRIFAFMMTCVLAVMGCGQALADVYVMKSSAVYASPKNSARKLGTLKAGTSVDVVAEKGSWAMVRKNGYTGYMKTSGLIEIEECNNMTAYTQSAANMYKSYSTSSRKLGKIAAGEAVTVSAKAGSWARISYKGYTGYVKASLLTTKAPAVKEEETVSYTVYAQKEGAKVYNKSGKVIGSVALNTEMICTGVNGNICRVIKDGKTAYMKKADLDTVKAEEVVEPEVTVVPEVTIVPEATAAPEPEKEETTSYTVYAAKDDAKVYNKSGKKIGTVALNTKMLCTGVNGSICRVVKDGKTAYMKKSDLSTTEVEVEQENTIQLTAYANKEGAKVYNASGKVISTLAINTQVTVTAIKDSLCRVEKDGKTAYMKKADLSSEKVEESDVVEIQAAKGYVKNDGAKVYDASGSVIATLKVNDEVTVTAYNDELCQVTNGSVVGYMKKGDVSGTKVEVDDGVVEIKATKGYVKNDGAKVYDASGSVIATLKVNAEITVTAYNDELCQVTNGSVVGYMKKGDVSNTKVEESDVVEIQATKGYVKNDGAKVYDASGSVIATLKVNAEVTVTAYNDELCQVTNGSVVGYMKKGDVSNTKVETNDYSNYCLKYGDTGEAVKRVQSRLKELGYFSGDIGGNYLTLTQSAVAAFQKAAKLTANGIADYETLKALFSDDAPKYVKTEPEGGTSSTPTATPATGTAVEADWWTSGIQSIFARGTTAVVTDVATGLSWREKRTGGTNHADVQPLTASDTAVLKKVYGGSWSWSRRAVFVTINGVNYAASMNGMPHGSGSITNNNFNGHHCIHFTNSRTHGSNKVCSLHQAAIKKALNATL